MQVGQEGPFGAQVDAGVVPGDLVDGGRESQVAFRITPYQDRGPGMVERERRVGGSGDLQA